MSTPLVSVCIPTYNYRRFLPDALESAMQQTLRDLEIVVVDNHSSDGSMELLSEFARRDPRIVVHRNSANIGMVANFNRCIELARGKYVKLLCADDVLADECIERLVSATEEGDDVRLAGCSRYYFTEPHKPRRFQGYGAQQRTAPGGEVVRTCFFRGNLIGEPTAVLFRRSDPRARFDPAYLQAFDMELWFRLLEQGSFAFVAEALCGVREHHASGTSGNLRDGRVTQDKLLLFAQYAPRPELRGTLLERLRWDSRMASSVAREAAAGSQHGSKKVLQAIYHPALFRLATLPLARLVSVVRH